MVELQKLKADVLADGCLGDEDVELICRSLYPEGKIDQEVVEFLIAIRDEARLVCPAFQQFLFDAILHHVLSSGILDHEKVVWLRSRLFTHSNSGIDEKKLLWELKRRTWGYSGEFQQLYDEYM